MHCNQNPGTGFSYVNMSFDKKVCQTGLPLDLSFRPKYKFLSLVDLMVKNAHFYLHTQVGLVFLMQVLRFFENTFFSFTTLENLSFYLDNHCTTMLA